VDYLWSVATNTSGGTLNGNVYTAGQIPGVDVIQVEDSVGVIGTTTLTVVGLLSVTPASPLTVVPMQSETFTANGGLAPFQWTLQTGGSGGSLTATGNQGTYKAGALGNSQDSITISDSLGQTVTITVSVGPGITVTPASSTIAVSGTVQFSATGGSGTGYVWSVQEGSAGSFTGSTYAAASVGGVNTVVVTDSLGNVATATVTVAQPLSVLPASPVVVAPLETVTLAAENGLGPFTWRLAQDDSNASFQSSGYQATYTAGSIGNVQDVVVVTDSLGETVSVTLDVGPGITITPLQPTVVSGSATVFTAIGGSGTGYVWTVDPDTSGATFNGSTYTAGPTPGTDTVKVTDGFGNTASTTVTVVGQLKVQPPSPIQVAPLQSLDLTTAGGVGPFTWTLTPGGSGATLLSRGAGALYQAGINGNTVDTVTVTDSLSETVTVLLDVGPGITITPSSPVTLPAGVIVFQAQGGSGSQYVWSIARTQSGAKITGNQYTAGPSTGVDVVQVTDNYGNVATVTVTVVLPLQASPASPVDAAPNQPITFQLGTTGAPPFTWTLATNGSQASLQQGCGSSCTYTAGSTPNTQDVVSVVDAIGEDVLITVNVGAGVTISPLTPSVVVGKQLMFTASGGESEAGYTWAVIIPGSGGSFNGSTYTAGAAPGVDTVEVSDVLGNSATTTVTVVSALTVSPTLSPLQLSPGQGVTFVAAGGAAPFVWTYPLHPSGGSLTPNGRDAPYTAGRTPNTVDWVVVTDGLQETVTRVIDVGPAVSISPATSEIGAGQSENFTAAGGSGGYQFSVLIDNSGGSFSPDGGSLYTGGSAGGSTQVTDTVEVTDSVGNTATAEVVVVPGLSVNPPSGITVAPHQPVTFVASAGLAPYTWNLATNGSGTVLSPVVGADCPYQAGAMGNSVDVLRVVDALNEEMTIIINVGAGVSITPASASAMSGQTLTFVASGGSGTAYSWSFPLGGNKSGAELNDGGQGEFYTAGPTFGVTDKIQVVDSFGNTATATVTVTPGPRPDAGPGVDAGTTDAGGDAGPVDAGEVDAGEVDAGEPDSGSDAGPGVSDAGPADGGGNEVDAGDAGETDAGDAGEVDAGDAGEVDAGDAGEVDAGGISTVDAGSVDAGQTPPPAADAGSGKNKSAGCSCNATGFGGEGLTEAALFMVAAVTTRRRRSGRGVRL
jgi:hypothetical protein